MNVTRCAPCLRSLRVIEYGLTARREYATKERDPYPGWARSLCHLAGTQSRLGRRMESSEISFTAFCTKGCPLKKAPSTRQIARERDFCAVECASAFISTQHALGRSKRTPAGR